MTDRRTDGRTDSIYRASHSSMPDFVYIINLHDIIIVIIIFIIIIFYYLLFIYLFYSFIIIIIIIIIIRRSLGIA